MNKISWFLTLFVALSLALSATATKFLTPSKESIWVSSVDFALKSSHKRFEDFEGAQLKLYRKAWLFNRFVAAWTVDGDGRGTISLPDGMRAGKYRLEMKSPRGGKLIKSPFFHIMPRVGDKGIQALQNTQDSMLTVQIDAKKVKAHASLLIQLVDSRTGRKLRSVSYKLSDDDLQSGYFSVPLTVTKGSFVQIFRKRWFWRKTLLFRSDDFGGDIEAVGEIVAPQEATKEELGTKILDEDFPQEFTMEPIPLSEEMYSKDPLVDEEPTFSAYPVLGAAVEAEPRPLSSRKDDPNATARARDLLERIRSSR